MEDYARRYDELEVPDHLREVLDRLPEDERDRRLYGLEIHREYALEELEYEAIDWSTPNEENGYYPNGRQGSRGWLETRERSAVEIATERLTRRDAPYYMPLDRKNPLPNHLTNEQWREVRQRVEAIHIERAEALLEDGFAKYGRFLEGRDLLYFRDLAKRENLDMYITRARKAASIFEQFADALKDEEERHTANVRSLGKRKDDA